MRSQTKSRVETPNYGTASEEGGPSDPVSTIYTQTQSSETQDQERTAKRDARTRTPIAVTQTSRTQTQSLSRQRRRRGPLLTPPSGKSVHGDGSLDLVRSEHDLSVSESSLSSIDSIATATSNTSMVSDKGGAWANKPELLLSLAAFTIGYADVWRFPYMMLKYSGVYLIPYLLFQILLGFPIVYMELALGQFSNFNAPAVFLNLAPILQGLGWAMVLTNALHQPHYNVITAWLIYYFFNAFELNWKSCKNAWNTNNCTSVSDDKECSGQFGVSFYFSKVAGKCVNGSAQRQVQLDNLGRSTSSYEFFYYHMYNANDTHYAGLGQSQWQLTLCLLLCWMLTLVCVIRSIRSFGIIVYFTAGLPLISLFILLIYGATLDNAGQGFHLLAHPTWKELGNPSLWLDAGTSVLYTNGTAIGVLITLASNNKFKNNCFRDSMFVVGINTSVSLVSSFSVLLVLGSVAAHYGVNASDVANVGPNVAFVVYAQGLSQDQFGTVFSVLFFLVLVLVGLDTVFIKLESIVASLCDQWPFLLRYRWAVASAVCTIFFIVGVPMCTERGFLFFALFHQYSFSYSLPFLALLQVVCAIYLYGFNNLIGNIRTMIGAPKWKFSQWIGPTGKIMAFMWCVGAPGLLVGLILLSIFCHDSENIKTKKEARFDHYLSEWAKLLGWLMVFAPLAMVWIFGAVRAVRQLRERRPLEDLFHETEYWCPSRKRRNVINKSYYAQTPKPAQLDTPGLETAVKR